MGHYYVLVNGRQVDGFLASNIDGDPKSFDTEEEAIDDAKGYQGKIEILRAVARLVVETTYTVKKI
jgi:hypothetical protein